MTSHRTPFLLAALALILTGQAPAPEPAPSGIEPEARRFLDDVAQVYRALPAYADQGAFSIALKVDGQPVVQTWKMALTFARPNQIALDAGEVRLVGDGKTVTTTIVPARKYMVAPVSADLTPIRLTEGPLGAMLLGGPTGPAASHLLNAYVLMNLLVGDDPTRAILEPADGLRFEPDRALDGRPAKVLQVEQSQGPDFRMLVDPESKLLRRIELVVEPAELAEKAPPGVTLGDVEIAWSAGAIAVAPPGPGTFAFQPPAGFTQVRAVEVPEEAEVQAHALVGKSAPEFNFLAIDDAGQTRRLHKADLAGKVVVLDFWATWCPPCLVELPEIEKLMTAYDRADRPVVIVALNQDKAEETPGGVRPLVEKTLTAEKLDMIRGDVGKLALDPTNAVADAFLVQFLPTLVILDADGIVQAVYEDLKPKDARETLTRDIDALLQGKSLLPGKGAVEAKADRAKAAD